jgi:predicted dithiol-disulfide oxidoreductase (DUF899 family)
MVEIDKAYVFETPHGRATLHDLFEGRRQLIVYHFMFHGDRLEGCPGCSHMADDSPYLAHMHARDTTFVLVSRAPLAEIEPFKRRMGWTVTWYSSAARDQRLPARRRARLPHLLDLRPGLDLLLNTYNRLDLTPLGRGEGWDGMPDLEGKGMGWLRHYDRYRLGAAVPAGVAT